MNAQTYTKSGSKATSTAKLDNSIFGLEVKDSSLIKQVYNAYLANGRDNLAITKTRGLVRGGGRKPWKQKGTGHARFGSIRNPIWKGGGIVFGPTGNENYTMSLTTSSKRLALKQALSLKAKQIYIIEIFDAKDGKVKQTVSLLDKLKANRNVLMVVEDKDDLVNRATHNISYVNTLQAKYLNVYTVMNADYIIITKKALQIIHEWLGGKENE